MNQFGAITLFQQLGEQRLPGTSFPRAGARIVPQSAQQQTPETVSRSEVFSRSYVTRPVLRLSLLPFFRVRKIMLVIYTYH